MDMCKMKVFKKIKILDGWMIVSHNLSIQRWITKILIWKLTRNISSNNQVQIYHQGKWLQVWSILKKRKILYWAYKI